MGRTTQDDSLVRVNIGPDGDDLPSPIDVRVEFVRQVDVSYGEDADGRGGTICVEYEIVDAWIEPEDLKPLTPALAAWAIESAKDIFLENVHHF